MADTQHITIRRCLIILEFALLESLIAFIGDRPLASDILANFCANFVVMKIHAFLEVIITDLHLVHDREFHCLAVTDAFGYQARPHTMPESIRLVISTIVSEPSFRLMFGVIFALFDDITTNRIHQNIFPLFLVEP